MNLKYVLVAVIALFAGTNTFEAQTVGVSFPDSALDSGSVSSTSQTIGPAGEGKKVKIDFVKTDAFASVETGTATISYTGLENTEPVIYEAVVRATSAEECLASRDLSTAVPVGADRATLTFDRESNTSVLRWFGGRVRDSGCRVLLVRDSVNASDLAVWRANYGANGLIEDESGKFPGGPVELAPQRSRITTLVVTFQGQVSQ